jgi:hypothetical protein
MDKDKEIYRNKDKDKDNDKVKDKDEDKDKDRDKDRDEDRDKDALLVLDSICFTAFLIALVAAYRGKLHCPWRGSPRRHHSERSTSNLGFVIFDANVT